MKQIVHLQIVILTYFGFIQGNLTPASPRNVTLLADNKNIAVRWEPPTEFDVNIQKYIVSWAILPNIQDLPSKIVVGGSVTIAFIAINDNSGRLFRIRVRAENICGVGNYSTPRYIRIGCGHDVYVAPNKEAIITSPGFDAKLPLKPGVICKWNVTTDHDYVLNFIVKEMDLFNSSEEGKMEKANCAQTLTYINVSNAGLFCHSESVGRESTTRRSSVIVTLMTGEIAGGKGFILSFKTAVKSPGPPVNIRARVTKHAVWITWQPPTERTLPVTSYIIQYRILPTGHAYKIVVASSMTSFPINTDKYKGKLMTFNVKAAIQNIIGEASSNVYARAACSQEYYLQPEQSINITSPNYPDDYPDSIVCIWRMRSSPEVTLRMTFYDFQLEDMPFCSSDYVMISYKLEQECARIKVPRFIETNLHEINITFVTDNVNQYKGFLIGISAETAFSRSNPGLSHKETHVPQRHTDIHVSVKENENSEMTVKGSSTKSSISAEMSNTRRLSEWKTVYEQTTSSQFSTQFSKLSPKYSFPFSPSSGVKQNALISSVATRVSTRPFMPVSPSSALIAQTSTPFSLSQLLSPPPSFSSAKSIPETTTRMISDVLDNSSTQTSHLDQTIFNTNGTVRFGDVTEYGITSTAIMRSISGNSKHSETPEDSNNGSKDVKSKSRSIILALVLASVGGCVILACIVVILMCRKRRRRRKINVENNLKYRAGQIELHDILQCTPDTVYGGHDGVYKTVSSRDTTAKPQSRKRHSTFPLCFSLRKRQVHREITRQMAVFGSFIEDTEALETRLRRRYEHRRTSSF